MNKINSLFNINAHEWPRVMVAWGMMFLTRFGFIVGWSVLVATFLAKVGIDMLPSLFLANALMVMLGTVFFRKLINSFKREHLITGAVLAAVVFMLSSIIFIQSNSTLFFVLLLTAEAVLVGQLSILIALFNEELFTPLESQRTFPVIESAETVGGIMGGLALNMLANSIPAYKFIVMWAIALILILPIVLRYNSATMDIPKIEGPKEKKEAKLQIKKMPFVKGLMVVIMLHWAIMNVVEFQYTKAIQQDVYSVQEETLVIDDHIQLAAEDEETEHHYEQAITKKLGLIHMLANGAALLIQLILASRILVRFGVVATLAIHPLVTLLNLTGLTLRYGFTSAALTKASYELTGLMFKNASDSSYYAMPERHRGEIKEIIQGYMKPMGAIVGTLLITLIALGLSGTHQTLALNIVLLTMTVAMVACITQLGRKYTQLSEQNLSRKSDMATRLNAIEILAQNGHNALPHSLLKILRRSEPEVIKLSILKTLSRHGDAEHIPAILELLEEDSDTIRLATAETVLEICSQQSKIHEQGITKHHVLEAIQSSLETEENEHVLKVLMDIYTQFDRDGMIATLLKRIKEHPKKRAHTIHMLKEFSDTSLKHYLEPFLEDKDPAVKGAAIVSLWQFKELRKSLEHYLNQLLRSPHVNHQVAGFYAAGWIDYSSAKKRLRSALRSENDALKESAALALAQMEDKHAVEVLVSLFADPKHTWFHQNKMILSNASESYQREVEQALKRKTSTTIAQHIQPFEDLKKLEKSTLEYLKSLYQKMDSHHEAQKIQMALDSSD